FCLLAMSLVQLFASSLTLHSFPTRRSPIYVVGQLAAFGKHLGDRQLPPVRLQVLAPAVKFALPAVVLCQGGRGIEQQLAKVLQRDRKSTRLNSSHVKISYAVCCLTNKNRHR